MGWEDYHLHQFIIEDVYYGAREADFDFGRNLHDESEAKLSHVVPDEKMKFSYEYDFGDSWYHQLLVEKILSPEDGMHYPICIKGKRACPPEDMGGVGSYESFLDIISDSDNPERAKRLEWLGSNFNPEAFDLDSINEELKRIG